MELQTHVFLVLLFFLFELGNSNAGIPANAIGVDYGIGSLNRSSFPTGFVFGTASSSYQYKGAAHEDGRGPSIWDYYTRKYPDKIKDRSNGDVAIDSYHLYKADVKLMKQMGLDVYRFSISWSRILPYGKLHKGVNPKGLAYYHNLIDELIANGIKPFVTLFHWDLPQALEDEYGGFLSPYIVDDFSEYANICFREFGDKVKHWIALNEPWSYSYGGYASGFLAPGRCSKWQQLNCTGGDSAIEPYLVTHHQLLAHATAVNLYKRKYQASQKGIIGITLVSNWFVPISKRWHHQFAAGRALDFMFGWFMDPITKGEYPCTMRSLVQGRLPRFSAKQSRLLNGSYDFLGMNYYTAYYAAYSPTPKLAKPSYITDSNVRQTGISVVLITNNSLLAAERNGILIGPQAGSEWLHIYPRGIRDLLLYVKKKYNNPLIYITENGVDEVNNDKLSLAEALSDKMRVQYHHDHLSFLCHAIKKGVNVKGYFAWSLLDNFEWSSGYTVRFGINYVDYKHGLKRHPKLSAYWFKKFLQNQKY